MWFNYIIGDFSHSYYGVAASKSAYGPFEVKVPVVNTTRIRIMEMKIFLLMTMVKDTSFTRPLQTTMG